MNPKIYKTLGIQTAFVLVENNLILYTAMTKPIWTYGIELWGRVNQYNFNRLINSNKNINIVSWFSATCNRRNSTLPISVFP